MNRADTSFGWSARRDMESKAENSLIILAQWVCNRCIAKMLQSNNGNNMKMDMDALCRFCLYV